MASERNRETPTEAVIVVSGLIASGKSTVSKALAEALGLQRLEADRIRGTLLGAADNEASGTEARWRRDLSPGFEAEIYDDLMRRAAGVLDAGDGVVLDACFPLASQRDTARALAARRGCRFFFVSCVVADDVRQARLDARDQIAGRAAWHEIDRRLADHFEAPHELPAGTFIEIDSEGPVGPNVEQIEHALDRAPAAISSPTPQATATAAPVVRPLVVSFDCWGTLLSEEDWHWAHGLRISALERAAWEAKQPAPRDTVKQAFENAWHKHQTCWQSGEESGARQIADWGLAELGIEGRDDVRDRLVRRFEEASHTGQVVALEGARTLLAALTRSGIPSVLVCDTGLTPGRVVRRLLDGQGLLEHLVVQAFSNEVGAPKPDPKPFLAALEPLGVVPGDVWHVGDLRRTDVAGARNLGMTSVRIRARHDDTSELADADHVVDSHLALGRLLRLQMGD